MDFLDAHVAERAATDSIAAEVVRQVQRYFADPSHVFSLPLALPGTPFQQRVWQALCAIPPGQPRRYGELARQLGSGARAVGGACRANPVPIIVPCHRVVGAQGLGGYLGATAEEGLLIKRWLLEHESRC
ncbi:MAG: methylated-DNA--[protein]-cysteine S-methyltransferase [Gammaproteobacteria bacterium]|nr:methylated-DNA--[protein]-cysteine S-methyltransferase [Gammaproteobacteria bacterium]